VGSTHNHIPLITQQPIYKSSTHEQTLTQCVIEQIQNMPDPIMIKKNPLKLLIVA